ncbi:MAG: hypothetical protein RJA44_1446 [Pseudomonadota bacterium]|jgi:hypothetical protein
MKTLASTLDAPLAAPATAPVSVLMQSARTRITLVAGLLGALWLAVLWALA